jgi:murein tripeptide amidase MpaA
MNKFIFSVALLALASQAPAAVKIEEELYLMGQNPEVVRELITAGSVEVDHVTSHGFELYGSKGLAKYLNEKNIPFYNMKSVAKSMLAEYPTHAQITAKLQAAAAKNPSIMKLVSIGKSIKGKELWVMKISDNVNVDEVEPEFKYISSMHGDEITGREMTTFLIEEIAAKYGSDAEITELVNNSEIYIMPSMNPDGSERKQRANANGADLNRNFPDLKASNTTAGRELEN